MNFKKTKSFMQFYYELGLTEIFSKHTSSKLKIVDNETKKENLNIEENKNELLNNLKAEILNTKIGLQDTATNLVFGAGNINSKIMIVGDAPDTNDDREGLPFQGIIGNFLERILQSINLSRKDTYLSNLVFWRPPGNRSISQEEVKLCLPLTIKHIKIIKPAYLIILGGIASKSILETEKNITELRGKVFDSKYFKKTKIFPIFHPKFLAQNTLEKKITWLDLLHISEIINN